MAQIKVVRDTLSRLESELERSGAEHGIDDR